MLSSLDGLVILRPNHSTTRLVDTVIFGLSFKPARTSRKLPLELHIFPDASIWISSHNPILGLVFSWTTPQSSRRSCRSCRTQHWVLRPCYLASLWFHTPSARQNCPDHVDTLFKRSAQHHHPHRYCKHQNHATHLLHVLTPEHHITPSRSPA